MSTGSLSLCGGTGSRESLPQLQMGDNDGQDWGEAGDERAKAGSGNILKEELPGFAEGLDMDVRAEDDWQGCGPRSWESSTMD